MSLLAELKRRNVLRMAGLYLVGAWLVVQVAATVLPLFGAPEWLARSVVVLLAIGFLPALAFAWVFEWTPEGLKRDAELGPAGSTAPRTARRMDRMILVVLALALAAFAAARLLPSSRDAATPEGGPATAAVAAKAAHPKSIAVLPFANLSDDKANEYFVSGMQDMILTKLSEVRELRVASRTSTERYADHRGSVRDIAAELGVAHVLEGSVQKAGNRVLINLQLIDGRNDEHLWARAYERTLDDIFGVEGEVAKLVAEALHAELSVAEAAAVASVTTHDKEAYDRLLRSRFFLNQSNRSFDPADLDRSIELAREAVALDPGYVDGWALLSLAHVKRRGPDAAEEAEASARRVLALDPDHARGHLHLGFALALLLAGAAWVFDRRTLAGFQLRATGANPLAAQVTGRIPTARYFAVALLASAGLAGLAGGMEVTGTSYALFQNLSPGYGFTAIAVALLARLDPLGIVATGLLFAGLEAGASAMQREAGVPAVAVYMVEATIIIAVLLADVLRRRRLAEAGAE